MKRLPVNFYHRNTLEVAAELLGKVLGVRTTNRRWLLGRIVETEAYRADDPASHSAFGLTPRNQIMFGEPSFAYVYFIYGMYRMLNIVTEPKGCPGAVLIRAIEPLQGEEEMLEKRLSASKTLKIGQPRTFSRIQLTNGPGRLTQALGIEQRHNGQSVLGNHLGIFKDDFPAPLIVRSKRVGLKKGVHLLWRFYIPSHPFVSPVPENLESQPFLFSDLGSDVGKNGSFCEKRTMLP